jgi:hypothetical protein
VTSSTGKRNYTVTHQKVTAIIQWPPQKGPTIIPWPAEWGAQSYSGLLNREKKAYSDLLKGGEKSNIGLLNKEKESYSDLTNIDEQ